MHQTIRSLFLVAGSAALLLNTACYSYEPSPPLAPAPTGQPVRVELTLEGTTELADKLGPRVKMVEGRVASVAGDGAIVVGPVYVTTLENVLQPWSGEGTVAIPARDIVAVRVKTFNRRSTVTAVVVLAAVVAVLAVAGLRSGGVGGQPSAGGGSPPP